MQLKTNTTIYYVSTLDDEAGDHSSMGLATLVRGGIGPEVMLFTEEQEAIDAAKRVLALRDGKRALESLSTEELISIVPMIDKANIEDTMDHMAHRCE